MSLNEKKPNRGYATVAIDDGVNYREIADVMTELGFNMNHSSARNYVIRVMRKFVKAFANNWDIQVDDNKIDEIAKSPAFQYGIADQLQIIEQARKEKSKLLKD